jgi:hypothetical protein
MVFLIDSPKWGLKKVFIDEEDIPLAIKYNWHVQFDGYNFYCRRNAYDNSKKSGRAVITMHREIMGFPKGKLIDHINGNSLDNRKENLRICTNTENCRHCRKQRNSKMKYKGITKIINGSGWVARIGVNNKRIYLGYYNTEEEAYAVYCKASKKYHGEFGRIE